MSPVRHLPAGLSFYLQLVFFCFTGIRKKLPALFFSFVSNIQIMKKAKHTIGDPIHVKMHYKDDNLSLVYYGTVTGARLHRGPLFPDRILYDVSLKQTAAPPVRIENLPEGLIMAGAPEMEEEDIPEMESDQSMNQQ